MRPEALPEARGGPHRFLRPVLRCSGRGKRLNSVFLGGVSLHARRAECFTLKGLQVHSVTGVFGFSEQRRQHLSFTGWARY